MIRRALDDNRAAVCLDDAVTNGESQAQALSLFGGKKRLENFLQRLRIDSESGIGHRNGNGFVGLQAGGHGQLSSVRHSVHSVQAQVGEDLL